MNLERLEICGIGPFGGTSVIDFSRLATSGLYLLDGPTGSGKSTIIDSITWALFGGVAGGEDSTDERMRSSHADPAVESYVDLIFTVESGTYRVRRTPRWLKEGTKNPRPVSAKLWKLDPSALSSGHIELGEVLEIKAQGVGAAISEIVGLNRKQFVQTIVLPQGKFAEFLRLSSADRTRILERIFDTSLYSMITDALVAEAGSAGEQTTQAQLAFSDQFALAANSLESDTSQQEITEIRAATLPQAARGPLETLGESLGQAIEAASEASNQAQSETAAAQSAIETYTSELEREKHFARRDTLRSELAELDTQRGHFDGLEHQLSTSVAASEIFSAITESSIADQELSSAWEEYDPAGIDRAVPDLDQANSLLAELNRELGKLNQLLDSEELLVTLEKEQTAATAKRETLTGQLSEYLSEQALLPERLQALSIQQESASAREHTIDQRKLELAQAHAKLDSVLELEAGRENQRECIGVVEKLTELTHQAHTQSQQVTTAWLASMSGIIAQELEPAKPCPVCGSEDHPAPAPPTSIQATWEAVEAANSAAAMHQSELANAQAELNHAAANVSQLEASVGELAPSACEEAILVAQSTLDGSLAARSLAKELARQLGELEQTKESLDETISQVKQHVAELDAEITQRGGLIDATEATVHAGRAGFPTIQARVFAQQEELDLQNAKVALIIRIHATKKHSDAAASILDKKMAPSQFDTEEAVKQAVLSPAKSAEISAEVSQYKERISYIDQALEEIAELDLDAGQRPDLPHLRIVKEQAVTRRDDALNSASQLNHKAATSASHYKNAEATLKDWEDAYQSAGPVARLAELAQGGKASLTKVPLATFALQKRFERVVARANDRLLSISLGRYELVRTDEKEKGTHQIKAGLGLEIIDHLGNEEGEVVRSTRSLSGGESFYVSLALALALAEVVQAENGGVHLGSLMIDEGFGTLDDDTLNQVMETLTSLATSGRSVGIVSHVAELNKMISQRISVRPQPDGSSRLEVIA